MGKGRGKIRPSQPPTSGNRIGVRPDTDPVSANSQKPTFNLEHLRGRYCLSECTQEQKAAFADALHKLSSLTWAEIQVAHRHGLGCETIPRSSLRGNPTLPTEATADVRLLAFRFFGKAPMVGYRVGRTFVVLFLDRNFTLYDHG